MLTSKYCFGSINNQGVFNLKWNIRDIKEKVVLLLGADESYPYNGFPHTTHENVPTNVESLKADNMIINHIIDLKTHNNPGDDFCLLTMLNPVNYIVGHIKPLCLPEDPTKDYEHEIAEVYGFGYDTEDLPKIIDQARKEKTRKRMLDLSRDLRKHRPPTPGSTGTTFDTRIYDRQHCLRRALKNCPFP